MKASRIITFILGIVMIITGVYCLFTPMMTYMTLGYIVGFNMVMDAIGGIVTRFDAAEVAAEVAEAERVQEAMARAAKKELREAKKENRQKEIEEKREKLKANFANVKAKFSK